MTTKVNSTEELQSTVQSLAAKLRGISYLFSRMQPENGSDRDAFIGIGEMLRELAEQSAEVKAFVEQMRPSGTARKAATSKSARRDDDTTTSPAVSEAEIF